MTFSILMIVLHKYFIFGDDIEKIVKLTSYQKNNKEMIVDLSYLREMSGGNKELILEMISIFNSQVKDFGNEMDQLLGKKEYLLLGKLAHKAKSSVSIMGLNDLAKQLKDLENSANAGDSPDNYPKIISNFKKITGDAVKELELVSQNFELYF